MLGEAQDLLRGRGVDAKIVKLAQRWVTFASAIEKCQ